MEFVNFAVNGTLMRGLELNGNMHLVGAKFMREAYTEPNYRLWSIADRHPAMQRVTTGGHAIAVEIWAVPAIGIATLLLLEPPGLCIGTVRLSTGEAVLGVLGEAVLCEGQKDITAWGGWRAYAMDGLNATAQEVATEPIPNAAAYVDQVAAAIGLPIPSEYRQSIVENFERIAIVAQQVMDVPLPEATEIAPVFEP
jgi:hypothetical protein